MWIYLKLWQNAQQQRMTRGRKQFKKIKEYCHSKSKMFYFSFKMWRKSNWIRNSSWRARKKNYFNRVRASVDLTSIVLLGWRTLECNKASQQNHISIHHRQFNYYVNISAMNIEHRWLRSELRNWINYMRSTGSPSKAYKPCSKNMHLLLFFSIIITEPHHQHSRKLKQQQSSNNSIMICEIV